MSERNLLNTIKFFVFAIVAVTPLFFISDTVYPAIIPKTALFQSLTEAAFFLWLALVIFNKDYRPKLTPIVWGITVFLGALIITSIFGVDPSHSFWSGYERDFGVVTIIHMVAFMLIISSIFTKKDNRRLLYATLISSFVVAITAISQVKFPEIMPWIKLLDTSAASYYRPGSTFDNPSFLAGYLIFNFFFALYLLFDEFRNKIGGVINNNAKKSEKNLGLIIFLFLSMASSIIALFFTQTRGAILGWGMGLFILLILFTLRPPALTNKWLNKRSLYGIVLVLIIVGGAGFWFTRSNSFWSRIPGLNRFKDVSVSLSSEELQPRLSAIRAAWKGFLDKPVLGWGWENFNIVFNKYYDPHSLELNYQETRFDKPHNFLMELLNAGGIALTLAFLGLVVAFIWEAWRSRNIFGQIAVATFVAYAVQNLFLFDTLGPALMLYMLFGLLNGIYWRESSDSGEVGGYNFKNNGGAGKPRGIIAGYAIYAAIVSAAIVVYFVNILTVQAAYDEYWAYQYLANGKVEQGINYFHDAIGVWSPYNYNFVRDYATDMSQAYFYNNNGGVPEDEVKWSIEQMEKVRDAHPLDAFNHYLLVDVYNQSSAIDPKLYLPGAEKEAAIALSLSPNRQEVYFSLSKTKYLEGDTSQALALLKYALELDENVPDAHFYYGVMAYAANDPATGYDEIEKSIKMGREWTIFYEPRTVAGLFADSGHTDEAIALYQQALDMQPQDIEAQIKLGLAYYVFKGNKGGARSLLSHVAETFDFTKSPLYLQIKPILDDLGIR
ncbi:MAG: O-antigen ligase family protein [Patescibacteria group bacterium]|nr:O-antigen ligase family protein [Patescibacteria group bacterium]MDE2015073.1 O-antigen ligase family protein [Patescibacteria group bacterium]MDE2226501.1 O-antigen ligase family protein [Patescibacteria group bacterium]